MPLCEICCGTPRTTFACARCAYATCRTCERTMCADGRDGACARCARPWSHAEMRARLGTTYLDTTYRRGRARHLLSTHRPLLDEEILRLVHARADGEERTTSPSSSPSAVRSDPSRRCAGCASALLLVAAQRSSSSASASPPHTAACAARCGVRTCLRCGSEAHDGMECDPGAVETQTWIARECRPCVRCGAPSHRAEGCATMWCANCHCFWNWSTGRLITTTHRHGGVPHNPDHARYVDERARGVGRAPPRHVLDVPCGGVPDVFELNLAFMAEVDALEEAARREELWAFDSAFANALVIVSCVDAIAVALRRRQGLAVHALDGEGGGTLAQARRLVLDRANGIIPSDEALGQRLERADRERRFHAELDACYEAFVLAASDVLQRFVARACESVECLASLEALRELCNDGMSEASAAFRRTAVALDDAWKWRAHRSLLARGGRRSVLARGRRRAERDDTSLA